MSKSAKKREVGKIPRGSCRIRTTGRLREQDECVRDMFTAHMSNENIAEEFLADTRSPQDAYEYEIRRKIRRKLRNTAKQKKKHKSVWNASNFNSNIQAGICSIYSTTRKR